jgi:hypothetical protein
MARRSLAAITSAAIAFIGVAAPRIAEACPGIGLVTRIDGLPQNVIITRVENGKQVLVWRPRVLEVVCQDDLVHTIGATSVFILVDGRGSVRVNRDLDYRVPARSGAPSLAGNAYRNISDQVMPDMKRLPWSVRVKGGGDDFGFSLSALSAGGQQVQAGRRTLLVRLVGGAPPYHVEISTAAGAPVASQTSSGHEVVLSDVALTAGAYQVKAVDAAPNALSAQIAVVDVSPPADTAFAGLADPEVRAAASATALAKADPGVWSFEAEQQIEAAPSNGLDRDKVYELIESYSAE